MFGFLNIRKIAGQTSRDVVNRVSRISGIRKTGHAGTLDPLATGVLVVCVGPATRLVDYIHTFSKTYRAQFRFGFTSTTEDVEGEVSVVAGAPEVTREQLEQILPGFHGRILQRPPDVSAVKIKGKRAYKLARAGKKVDIQPRPVSVHSISVDSFDFPDFGLTVCCGTGTYIRSLGRDIAGGLATGAIMTALERTAIGPLCLNQAIELAAETGEEELRNALINPVDCFPDALRISVTARDIAQLRVGGLLEIPEDIRGRLDTAKESKPIMAVQQTGTGDRRQQKLMALLKPHKERLKPAVNFTPFWESDSVSRRG